MRKRLAMVAFQMTLCACGSEPEQSIDKLEQDVAALQTATQQDDTFNGEDVSTPPPQEGVDVHRSEPFAFGSSCTSSGSSVDSARSCEHRGFRPRHDEPGYEFRQRLYLYTMPAFKTGWDHSGSITVTERRRSGSQDAWQPYRQITTCNHGACPGRDPAMKLREVCDPGVIIQGWYGEDGECSGDWGPLGWAHQHLCNDDLALQINNAFGRWTGDHCEHTGRMTMPHCQPHW